MWPGIGSQTIQSLGLQSRAVLGTLFQRVPILLQYRQECTQRQPVHVSMHGQTSQAQNMVGQMPAAQSMPPTSHFFFPLRNIMYMPLSLKVHRTKTSLVKTHLSAVEEDGDVRKKWSVPVERWVESLVSLLDLLSA